MGRILAVATKTSDAVDLRHEFSHHCCPSLAHNDDTPLKTDKATLTKALESTQSVVLTDATLLPPNRGHCD